MRRPLSILVFAALLVWAPRWATASEIAVHIVQPADGDVVAGTVTLAAETAGDVASVQFDWSSDGSAWTPIALDTQPADGWAAVWDTTGYSGPATVRATAADGTSTESAYVTIEVDNAPTIVVVASRVSISPNDDGRMDATVIRVTVGVPVTLSVDVLNAAGDVVRNLVTQSAVEAGSTQIRWDGKAGNGHRVPDGTYAVVAEATDSAGNELTATADVVVDTHRPTFALYRIAPDPMRTVGPVRFSFDVQDSSLSVRVSYVITDVSGTVVFRSRPADMRPQRAVLSWKGWLRSTPAPPGLYQVGFIVRDGAGNVRLIHPTPFRDERPVSTITVRRVDGAKGLVALTFDDCASASAWGRILSVLDARHAQASFFCSGVYVAANPELAQRTVALGETVGAHGWNHPFMSMLGEGEIRQQLALDANAWWNVARVTPVPWFRPPYGSYDQNVLSVVGGAGYLHTVLWDVDPQDWRRPGASTIAAHVLSRASAGSIVVMHTLDQTADALPAIIDGLRARGLEPVGLAALFAAT
jgi:peptidoglycan/xylan/chitin deacetylase (PgdA/CDA1 family)